MRDAGEIERAITAFARSPNGGLIVTGSAPAAIHRDLIITLAAQHKLPAVYDGRFFVTAGGLISYGPDLRRPAPTRGQLCRSHPQGREAGRSAGAAPTKYELVINLKTAKALDLTSADAAPARRRGDRMS